MTTDFDEIPVIDFEQFLNGNMEEKIKTAKTIGEACRNVGFFYLKNHGVSKQLTEDAMAQSKRYFALPLDVKMKQAVRGQPYDDGRGYSPIFVENFSDKKGDFKEIFDFSLEMKEDDPLIKQGGKLYGPNRWPELPGFREVLYDGYFSAMIELARQLARAFALALDLPEKYFDSLTEKPLTETILIYYPPQKLDKPLDPNSVGCREHTDIGGFTLLLQSSDVVALQVKNRQGEWVDAKPIEGTFVINIGDTMQRWTNDQFVSTVHRVINISDKERYAIGFFYGPNYFANIDCLPTCYDNEKCPKKYDPILAGEFITTRLYDQYQPNFADTDIGRLPHTPKNGTVEKEHASSH